MYNYTLFTAISNFEVEKSLWRPYLSKTSLKVFVNTTKAKIKVLAGFGQKLETKVLTLSLSPG